MTEAGTKSQSVCASQNLLYIKKPAVWASSDHSVSLSTWLNVPSPTAWLSFFQVTLFFCPSCHIIIAVIWAQPIFLLELFYSVSDGCHGICQTQSKPLLTFRWEVGKGGLWPAGQGFNCEIVWATNLKGYNQREWGNDPKFVPVSVSQ